MDPLYSPALSEGADGVVPVVGEELTAPTGRVCRRRRLPARGVRGCVSSVFCAAASPDCLAASGGCFPLFCLWVLPCLSEAGCFTGTSALGAAGTTGGGLPGASLSCFAAVVAGLFLRVLLRGDLADSAAGVTGAAVGADGVTTDAAAADFCSEDGVVADCLAAAGWVDSVGFGASGTGWGVGTRHSIESPVSSSSQLS